MLEIIIFLAFYCLILHLACMWQMGKNEELQEEIKRLKREALTHTGGGI